MAILLSHGDFLTGEAAVYWRPKHQAAYPAFKIVSFDAKRTQVAQGAYDFARYFTTAFESMRFGASVPRRAELASPEGMSTGGGRQARQSIVLVAERPGAPVLTVGWVEVAARRAQLRTHRALAAVHRARFRDRLLDIDEGSYGQFVAQAQNFLTACGIVLAFDDDTNVPTSQRPPPQQAPPDNNLLNYFAVGFVAFVIGAFAGGLAVYARFVGF